MELQVGQSLMLNRDVSLDLNGTNVTIARTGEVVILQHHDEYGNLKVIKAGDELQQIFYVFSNDVEVI